MKVIFPPNSTSCGGYEDCPSAEGAKDRFNKVPKGNLPDRSP